MHPFTFFLFELFLLILDFGTLIDFGSIQFLLAFLLLWSLLDLFNVER